MRYDTKANIGALEVIATEIPCPSKVIECAAKKISRTSNQLGYSLADMLHHLTSSLSCRNLGIRRELWKDTMGREFQERL